MLYLYHEGMDQKLTEPRPNSLPDPMRRHLPRCTSHVGPMIPEKSCRKSQQGSLGSLSLAAPRHKSHNQPDGPSVCRTEEFVKCPSALRWPMNIQSRKATPLGDS
jgi:hypothetical protein